MSIKSQFIHYLFTMRWLWIIVIILSWIIVNRLLNMLYTYIINRFTLHFDEMQYSEEDIIKHLDYIIDEAIDEYSIIHIRPKDIPYINNKMEEQLRNYLVETIPDRMSITLRSQLLLIYNENYLGKFLGSHIYMKVVEFVLNYNALKAPETKNNNG